MKMVSPLLKRVVLPALSRMGCLRKYASDGQLCVVTYHGVQPAEYSVPDPILEGNLVSAENLRAQLRLLKKHYQLIAPEHFLAWLCGEQQLPRRSVLLTCDDGLQNVLTDMVPVLRDEGALCLFFVTGSSIENNPAMLWYEQLYLALKWATSGPIRIEYDGLRISCDRDSERRIVWWELVQMLSECVAEKRLRVLRVLEAALGFGAQQLATLRTNPATFRRFFLLTSTDLLELAAQGMTVGAHTVSHPFLARSPDACAHMEVARSRALLADTLGCEVWAFAYPFGTIGSFSARDMALAEAAQFRCAFANTGGGFGADLPRFALPRVHVTADMSLGEFEAHVSGLYRRLRSSMDVGHAVDRSA